MKGKSLAAKIVDTMMAKDWFSQWMGVEVLETDFGKSKLRMTVRKEMLNGFGILHGGISYSLADSALAFASNSHGRLSMSVETSISHLISGKEGDILTATAEEMHLSNKIATYHITVTNQNNQKMSLFKGTVYRTSKEWFPEG